MQQQQTVTFAGREFHGIRVRTMENDFHTMRIMRAARLDTCVMQEGEAADDFASRLYGQAIGSPEVFDLLGCMLSPVESEDTAWTPATMKATADHLRRITEPAEKEIIQGAIVSMIAGFFQYGLASLKISPKSSSPLAADARPNSGTEGTATTATGS